MNNYKSKGKKNLPKSITKAPPKGKPAKKKPIEKKSIEKKTINKKNQANIQILEHPIQGASLCASIISKEEKQTRCLFAAQTNSKFCPMHLLETNPIIYNGDIDEIQTDRIIEPDPVNPIIIQTKVTKEIIKKNNDTANVDICNKNIPSKGKAAPKKEPPKKTVIKEQKENNVMRNYEDNEADLEIKLLILVNDEEYINQIPKLIGPVYNDITISDDDIDPITYDVIWKYQNGQKVPAEINKYFLFSYIDHNDKIKCLTIFTLYDILNSNNCVHPVTLEKIPDKDVRRARKLIKIYTTRLGMFKESDDSNLSADYKLKNRLNKLFSKYHMHSIYLEDKWLMSIQNTDDLWKIISESEKLVSNNLRSINSSLTRTQIFNKKRSGKKGTNAISVENEISELKEYIVSEWEKIVEAANDPQNQIPIWIIASGLSFITPDVIQKYPSLEVML